MGEIIKLPDEGREMLPTTPEILQRQMQQVAEAMAAMAAMVRATAESMEALRRQVQLLEKVTPGQASAINGAIRARAAELCEVYRAQGREKAVAYMIRKDMKLSFGAATVRELPRCDYESARRRVEMWDDYKAMKRMREDRA